jgi:hypothetical protein
MRRATEADVAAVTELVDAAYRHHVPRIGGLPGPMTADYRHVIAERAVTLAVADGSVAGLIVLAETPEGRAGGEARGRRRQAVTWAAPSG